MKTMYLEIRERNCSSDLWVRITKVELLVEEIELVIGRALALA